jgi:peptidoglycan-N-acetylglucosamine deacetylase
MERLPDTVPVRPGNELTMGRTASFFRPSRFLNLVFRNPRAQNSVAITFDDGPHPLHTPALLDELARFTIKATFFMTGANIRRNVALLQTVIAAGHEIANHTVNHPNLLFANRASIGEEIMTAKKIIEDATGRPNRLFRPPYGIVTPAVISVCRQMDMAIVLWSINSFDFKRRGAASIAGRVVDRVRSGDICLFHDCHFSDSAEDYSQTGIALKTILPRMCGRGLKGVTVGNLLAAGQ